MAPCPHMARDISRQTDTLLGINGQHCSVKIEKKFWPKSKLIIPDTIFYLNEI